MPVEWVSATLWRIRLSLVPGQNHLRFIGVDREDTPLGATEITVNLEVALGTWAVRNAMRDAGMEPGEVDGMLSYSGNDSTMAPFIAGDLGIRLNFYMDVHGGGSSTEALVGIAMGVIEAGMCKAVVIFRAMNGYSEIRIGGTGARSAPPVTGDQLHSRAR